MTKDISRLLNDQGKITIAALDHRGSLKKELHSDNPESVTDEEILAWKKRIIALYKDEVSGLLIDPVFGRELVDTSLRPGWLLSMEKTGYRGGQEARETTILEHWSVQQAKAMGACAVKLLLYYDPENRSLAKKQKNLAVKVAKDCEREGMLFLLEPLSYKIEDERADEVLRIVRDLKDVKADIFKFEYPGKRSACLQISQMIKAPWVLLSAGMEYSKYKTALKIACESGASGMAVGRAVWQEFGQYQGEEREKYFTDVALPRMRELVLVVNQYGKAIKQQSSQHTLPRLEQAKVKDKRVLVRVDWNVTLGKALQIVDDTRIVRTLPTIKYLLSHEAKQIVLLSHLGKPKGHVNPELSLQPVVAYASKLLGEEITLCSTVQSIAAAKSQITMLENLRFTPREEANDPAFAKDLASLGDMYVNEAFGESHREVASIVGIPQELPAYAGLWLAEEMATIAKVVDKPRKPFVVVMGGAKVTDKMKLLTVLQQKADVLLLGGGIANTFLAVQGVEMGSSFYEPAQVRLAEELLQKATTSGARIVLPVDWVWGDNPKHTGRGQAILDIGKKTRELFSEQIKKAATIVWNGPMGMVEKIQYARGTEAIFESIAGNIGAYTVVGGGDTLAALHNEELLGQIDHVSTGGGAMLTLIEQGSLVGIEALKG